MASKKLTVKRVNKVISLLDEISFSDLKKVDSDKLEKLFDLAATIKEDALTVLLDRKPMPTPTLDEGWHVSDGEWTGKTTF